MDWSKQESVNKLLVGLLIATLFIVGFNSVRLSLLDDVASIATNADSSGLTGAAIGSNSGSSSSILPSGVPAIYGSELKIRYDDVSAADPAKADQTIRTLGFFDQQMTLSGPEKDRYINILYTLNNGISCEYCCGARAVIFADGMPACGCAHSYAMRGLTKYLLTKHSSEYTDEQILEEVGKWKALFFPGQMELKAQALASQGLELNFINLASNKYRGLEQSLSSAGGKSSGMVGGC